MRFNPITSHVLYVEDIENSIDFYQKLGFDRVWNEGLMAVVCAGDLYIELWNNQACNVKLSTPKTYRDRHQHAIVIYLDDQEALMAWNQHLKDQGIVTDDRCIDESNAPFGYMISVSDPDQNLIIYGDADGPMWVSMRMEARRRS